jgi:hypothetical protein
MNSWINCRVSGTMFSVSYAKLPRQVRQQLMKIKLILKVFKPGIPEVAYNLCCFAFGGITDASRLFNSRHKAIFSDKASDMAL